MMRIFYSLFLLVLSCTASTAQSLIYSENFNEGSTGWKLDGGTGEWQRDAGVDGSGALMIVGSVEGNDSNRWLSAPLQLQPGAVYGIRFKVRAVNASGGSVVSGPDFCNVDFKLSGEEWEEFQYNFVVPLVEREVVLRFGQWHCKGVFYFDDIELFAVDPVYHNCGAGVVLGEGEFIEGNSYYFNSGFDKEQRNHSRVLKRTSAVFNSNRWCLHPGRYFEYLHSLNGRVFTSAAFSLHCGYYNSGRALVSISGDGGEWLQLGEISDWGTRTFSVPSRLLSSSALSVRVEGSQNLCNLQIYDYRFDAEFDGEPLNVTGSTRYFEKRCASSEIVVSVESLEFDYAAQLGVLKFGVENKSSKRFRDNLAVQCTQIGKKNKLNFKKNLTVDSGDEIETALPFELDSIGKWRVAVSYGDAYAAEFTLNIPAFYDSDYGGRLPCSSKALELWQASSGWKIPRGRRIPQAKSDAIEISLAINECEAKQLVLRPRVNLRNVMLKPGRFAGEGKVLPEGAVTIERVGYVSVSKPTDSTGVADDWPDPLLPLTAPHELAADRNQPYWIRVSMPKGVAAGEYEGYIHIFADGVEEKVALEIEVFDFELPDQMSCETAFGFNFNRVVQFHRLQTMPEKRAVLDQYLSCLSRYHISPYNPAPLDPWGVKIHGLPAWRGGTYVKGEAAAGEWSYCVEDRSEESNFSAVYGDLIAVSGQPLKLKFAHKSDQPRRTLFTLNQHRTDGSWISGNNLDYWVDGQIGWRREEFEIKKLHPDAAYLKITLWGAGYYEKQRSVGTTWFDDIAITALDGSSTLFDAGDFERRADPEQIQVEFDWEEWDRQMERAFNEYHFNTFRCSVTGLGSGSFLRRYEPGIEGLRENDPAYSVVMEKYLGGIESHLREKGWLNYAYVYWFDEPEPKDYDFVMDGFKKLQHYAPDLRRMLTEQVEPELVGGPNLWCPLTPSLNVEGAAERRAAGDQFWWYICCSPKAPYVTLFIDHPGVELRLWLWQSWAENVSGILIWDTVYWHSPSAYPNTLQNPYEDPMGWVNHVDTGVRQAWGNGDGRFLYPPSSIYSTKDAVIDPPNPTVRLEMLRDGLEDYEYFVILKRLLRERGDKLNVRQRRRYELLLAVPDQVSRSLTDFSDDPAALEKHRERLAEAIEDLTND